MKELLSFSLRLGFYKQAERINGLIAMITFAYIFIYELFQQKMLIGII